MMAKQKQLTRLRRLMTDHFNEEELRSLCFDLGKPYDQLPGRETESKTRELLAWCDRHHHMSELYTLLHELRPGVDWGAPPTTSQASTPAPGFPLHNFPFPRNPNFTGRTDLLEMLQQKLSPGAVTTPPLVISGLGGIGKTQLVMEYAYHHQNSYSLIWWLSAEDMTTLGTGFSALAGTLNLANPAAREQEVLVNLVLRWLTQTEHTTLLVFDNADGLNSSRMQPYLPKGGSGHILITSRNPNWGGVANVLHLDIFSEEEAVAFLQQRRSDIVEADARALAEALGYFPLALTHAMSYVETTGCTLADYLKLYTGRRQALWQRAKPPSNYHATISTTWDLAFQKIQHIQPTALDLLNLCCFLAADDIPINLLRSHADHLPAALAATVDDWLALDDAIAALRRYSMLAREGDKLNLHRLVQAVTRDRMDEKETQQWLETAVSLVATAWPFQDHDLATWEPSRRLLPHLLAVAEHAQKQQIETTAVADIHFQAGLYLHLHGDLADAKPFYEKALAVREAVLGADHTDTAQALNKLGHLLSDAGDTEQARPTLEQALALREAALGPDHPDVAESLDLLGNLLGNTGDDQAARPYLERALAIREEALGAYHPETAQSLNNLGVILDILGEVNVAQQCYSRAVEIWQEDPGPHHPKICQGLYNYGNILLRIGELEQAQEYFERALAIWEEAYGPHHPHTAFALAGLGNVMRDKENLQKARPYLERALSVRENALGSHHTMTAFSLTNLGRLLHMEGDLSGAQSYLERALAILQNKYGADHSYVKKTRDQLAKIQMAYILLLATYSVTVFLRI